MSNLWKKLVSLASALMMVICMGVAAPAHAEEFTYTPVSGNTVYVNAYAFMRKSAHTPSFNLQFILSPSKGMAADKKKGIREIKDKSLVTGVIDSRCNTNFNVFAKDTTEYSDSELVRAFIMKSKKDDNYYSSIYQTFGWRDLSSDQQSSDVKVMVARIPLDLNGFQFKEPGVYRFKLTQELHPNGNWDAIEQLPVKYAEDQNTRYLDVFVDSDESGELKITGSVMHLGDDPIVNDSVVHKNDEFLFGYKTYDVTIGKKVTGNQGNRDQYFEFYVEARNQDGNSSDDISVDLAKADDDIYYNNGSGTMHTWNPEKIGPSGAKFYLKNGQFITLRGLAKGSGHVAVKEISTPISDQYSTSYNKYVYESGAGTLLEEGYKINDILLNKLGAGTGSNIKLLTGVSNLPWNATMYDVSYLQDGSAYMWREDDTIYLKTSSKAYFNKDSSNMFANCTALNNIDLHNVYQDRGYFYHDDHKEYNFSGMFDGCTSLTELYIPSCDDRLYSEVLKCSGLKSLRLGDIYMRTFYLPPLPDGYVWKDKHGETFANNEKLDRTHDSYNTFTRVPTKNSGNQG